MESEISGSSVLKTYVAFNGYIDGITAGATYDRGTNLTATAVAPVWTIPILPPAIPAGFPGTGTGTERPTAPGPTPLIR